MFCRCAGRASPRRCWSARRSPAPAPPTRALFRNPLVSPDILGVSAGAALGAVLGILLSLRVVGIQALAFAGGLGTVALVYAIAAALRGHDRDRWCWCCPASWSARSPAPCIALVKYLADPYDQLPAITFWLLGSLAGMNAGDLAIVAAAGAGRPRAAGLLRWRIDVLSLRDDEARALGVDVGRLRVARDRRRDADDRERRRDLAA